MQCLPSSDDVRMYSIEGVLSHQVEEGDFQIAFASCSLASVAIGKSNSQIARQSRSKAFLPLFV